jgi:hypothetical protein
VSNRAWSRFAFSNDSTQLGRDPFSYWRGAPVPGTGDAESLIRAGWPIQKDLPGADKESNWPPAPDGPIYLVMRLYWPKTTSSFLRKVRKLSDWMVEGKKAINSKIA